LLAAARQLFVERGFAATRPQDITRAADVGSGTFYVHFADRREAFLAFTEEAAEELMEHVRAGAKGTRTFDERLYRSLDALLDYSDKHPGVLAAAFADTDVIAAGIPAGASLRDRLAHSVAEGLRQGMKKGELSDDFDPLVTAYGIVGMVHQALVFGARQQIDRAGLVENLTRFCSRALMRHAKDPAGR
jgi:AcrR family transcriptional regulator